MNPNTGLLEKKRLRFEKHRKRLGSDVKARKYAKLFCDAINEKLENGWSPYTEGENVKAFHKLQDAFITFLKEKEMDAKNGVFRADSMRTYKSQIKIINEWLLKTKRENITVGSFTKEVGQQYLDHVYMVCELSPRTYNNYLAFLRIVWSWFVEKDYCSENIFLKLKVKVEAKKERVPIPESWNTKIMEYFKQYNPTMELVCGLIYNSFMRPKEICRTQIKDLQLVHGGIYLNGSKSKNNRARWCLLPPHLIQMIIDLNIDRYPEDYYLLSTGLTPGKKEMCSRQLDKYWSRMRSAIGLPTTMKLYSYRDTGITDLKKQGHANLFISTITGHLNSDEIETYTHAPDPKALRYVVEKSRKL